MQHDERAVAAARLAVLDAMAAAVERRADLMALIADSPSADAALERLQAEWGFSAGQADAVLQLQVRRFAERERARIDEERRGLAQRIVDLGG